MGSTGYLCSAEAVTAVAYGHGVGCFVVVDPGEPVKIQGVAIGTGLVDRRVSERERADVGLVTLSYGDAVVALGDEAPAVERVTT